MGKVDQELGKVPDWNEVWVTDCAPGRARPVSASDIAENAKRASGWDDFNLSDDNYPQIEDGGIPEPVYVPESRPLILPSGPLPGSHSWTEDPFRYISLPFSHFLEPDGYMAIREMQKPNVKSFVRLMPRTADMAQSLLAALPQTDVWGKHLRGRPSGKDERGRSLADVSWATVTAGKWINGRGRPFPQKQMNVMDVLNMLANPEVHAVGNQDRHGNRHTPVRHVRVDIDMDATFDRERRNNLQGEIALCRRVFAAFGLDCHIMRTGNRGIQVIACIAEVDQVTASVIIEFVRTVLRDCRGIRHWQAKDFQTNLEGLMRLPLGRHAWTGSLAVFLDSHDAGVLPVEQQAATALTAFTVPSHMDMTSAERLAGWLKIQPERFGPAAAILPRLVRDNMDNPLVGLFLRACEEHGVPGWAGTSRHSCLHVAGELESHTNFCVSETSRMPDAEAKSSGERLSRSQTGIIGMKPSAPGLKKIAWSILNAGFAPGESHLYYTNRTVAGVKGKNAIGWAIVAFDGDRMQAQEWLDAQAEQVPALREADVADRKRYVAFAVTANDTYERYCRRRTILKHRNLAGEIHEEETAIARLVVERLPDLRREKSAQRTKVFQPQALDVIGHVVELALMGVRQSPDLVLRVSHGTLAAEMAGRWPASAVSRGALARHMAWIVAGESNCIFEGLAVVAKPQRAMDPTVYRLDRELSALLHK